jgi:hypothetical protein
MNLSSKFTPQRSQNPQRKFIEIVIHSYIAIYKHYLILGVLSVPCAIGNGGKNEINFDIRYSLFDTCQACFLTDWLLL